MEAEDVLDRDSLDAWLKGRTREVGRWVSYRSAMRVLPLWASLPADVEERKHGFIDLRFLRAHLTSGVCCNYATREVKNASSSCSVAAFSSVRKAFSATFNSTSYFASSARAAASSARTSVTHRATSSTSSTSVRAYTSAAADAAAARA